MDASIQYGHFQMLESNGLNHEMLLCDIIKVQFLFTACSQSFRYVLIIKGHEVSTMLDFNVILM